MLSYDWYGIPYTVIFNPLTEYMRDQGRDRIRDPIVTNSR